MKVQLNIPRCFSHIQQKFSYIFHIILNFNKKMTHLLLQEVGQILFTTDHLYLELNSLGNVE